MARHYKVDEVLEEVSAEDRASYEELLRRPACTIADLAQWLGERNLKVSKGAVWKHKRNFEQSIAKLRESTEFSRSIVQAARDGGGVNDIAEANLLQLQLRISDTLCRGEELEPGDLMKIAMSLRGSVATKTELEELKRRQKEAIEAATKAAAQGATGSAAVKIVKEMLGFGEKEAA